MTSKILQVGVYIVAFYWLSIFGYVLYQIRYIDGRIAMFVVGHVSIVLLLLAIFEANRHKAAKPTFIPRATRFPPGVRTY